LLSLFEVLESSLGYHILNIGFGELVYLLQSFFWAFRLALRLSRRKHWVPIQTFNS